MIPRVAKHPEKNNDIEILRAVAIVFTIVLHMIIVPRYFTDFNHYMFRRIDLSVGVDLFLVVSGFVITRSLLESLRGGDAPRMTAMKAFWVRRIYRLLPTAWIWLAVVLIYRIVLISLVGSWSEAWKDLLAIFAAFANVMNIYAGLCPPFTTTEFCAQGYMQGHYWSLSLEEQFYLIFPFLLFFLNRRLFIVMLFFSILFQLFWLRPMFTLEWYLKTDALSWGVLLAFFSSTRIHIRAREFFRDNPGLANTLVLALIITLPLIAARIQGYGGYMKPYGVGVVALICMLIVALASFDLGIFRLGSKCEKLALYLGSRSYALYVTHLIIFCMVRDINILYVPGIDSLWGQVLFDIFLCIFTLLLTFMISEWNYRVIEVPWRNKGRLRSHALINRARADGQHSNA